MSTNWLGRPLLNQGDIDARARDITSLMSHRCLRDRSDRRAIESCCAVLAGCFDATRPFRPQAERLAQYHYRAWCRSLGFAPSARDEQTAIEVMALWKDRCQRAA